MSDADDRFSLIEMDPLPTRQVRCKRCNEPGPVDFDMLCMACHSPTAIRASGRQATPLRPATGHALSQLTRPAIIDQLSEVAVEAAANASASGAGSIAAGQLASVGFTARDGYLTAIRNGVPAHTHASYVETLRTRYGMTSAELADLPGPMSTTVLPDGPGIVHTPTGPSIFDRPRGERAFIVGPQADERRTRLDASREAELVRSRTTHDLVAGAVAEGHHAIVAWEGTSGTTRGELVAQLEAIGRADLAPQAPSSHAHAGAAIAVLARGGLVVRAQRKGRGSELASGEHAWTVGNVRHTSSSVGDAYGSVVVRFRLTGDELTATGDEQMASSVIADFRARMASELFKSSDVTGWLGRVLQWRFDAVRFGAMGWLVPAVHVAEARRVVGAVMASGFGAGWVDGLPVATTDQLRDGIVRGLRDEIADLVVRIGVERDAARAAYSAWMNAGGATRPPARDIGEARAATHLKALRAIAARVVGYGQMLGEERVAGLRELVREVMAGLEGVLGEDYSGIRERFAGIWEEIEMDRRKNGGVL